MRFILLLSITALLAAGCAANSGNQGASPGQDPNLQAQSRQPAEGMEDDAVAVADRLAELARSVPGVNDATVLIVGRTAIVGIDVEGDLERARVGTLKYSVAEALRKDPYGVNAVVTADLDMRSRIAEIVRDVRAGRPISGFAEELADMIGRIVPQIPGDLRPQDRDNDVRSDRRKLNNKSL